MTALHDSFTPAHPAFEGHFPQNPIVPGALLLARVLQAAKEIFRARVVNVKSARFYKPVKPGELFEIRFSGEGERNVRFRVMSGDSRVAIGTIQLERAVSPADRA